MMYLLDGYPELSQPLDRELVVKIGKLSIPAYLGHVCDIHKGREWSLC
jgi:hypothetical protein